MSLENIRFAFLRDPRRQVQLLAAFVFFSLFPLLPGLAKYHGDECFYTDAGIRMMQTGDYLTPYAASGALRFAKPILPYWAVVAGYWVFGINFIGSRVFFLLAGCVVILLTYRLSLALFNRTSEAVLASLIMASNVQLLTISIRSTPDALLCLFVLLSLLGFARLIFQEDRSWMSYAMAWIGAGLAVQTRGLPGVGVALFPFLFCLLFRRGQTRLSSLLEWKAVILAMLVMCSWFVAMLWLHGRALIDGFYYDQVTENVRSYHLLDSLRNLQAYAVGVLRHFLPWSALLLVGLLMDRQTAARFRREHRAQAWFLAGWFLFIMAPFIFGGYYRTRYMIVAYPLLAVLLAALLSQYAAQTGFERWPGRILFPAWVIIAVAGVALALAGAAVHSRLLAGGLLLAIPAAACAWSLRSAPGRAQWPAAAALGLVPFLAVELCLRPVFSLSPAPALKARLLPDDSMRAKVYAINMSPSYQAQLRVLSAGRLTVTPVTAEGSLTLPSASDAVVFSETEKPLIAPHLGNVEQVGFASRKWRSRDFLDLLHSDRRTDAFARNRIPYYLRRP